jgi:hypothetical protein
MSASSEPQKGFYYHYKHTGKSVGDYAYEVLNIGHHTEIDGLAESAMVVYRPLYPTAGVYGIGKHWDVRPLAMFMESVTKEGKTMPRFRKVEDRETIEALEKIRKEMYGE